MLRNPIPAMNRQLNVVRDPFISTTLSRYININGGRYKIMSLHKVTILVRTSSRCLKNASTFQPPRCALKRDFVYRTRNGRK